MSRNIGLGLTVIDETDNIAQGDDVISGNALATKAAIELDRLRLAVLEASAGFGDLVQLTDNMVAPLVLDARTATGANIEALVKSATEAEVAAGAVVVTPSQYGVPVNSLGDATASFQAMLDALPDGATVITKPTDVYRVTAPLNLNKPVTVCGSGKFRASPNSTTLSLNADDITLDQFSIAGGSAAAGPVSSQNFIRTNGTNADRRRRIRIRNLKMSECQYIFMYLNWMTDFTIEHNVMMTGQYSGISMVSPKGGNIFGNTIRTMLQGGSIVNSYGITVTDSENTAAARAENVNIVGNLVDGVKDWEGIDTHGGRNIKVIGNTILNCRCGIAITTGNTSRIFPPEECTVDGNFIDRGTANSDRAGIVFNSNTGNPIPCSGTIGTNIIRGYAIDLDLINWDPKKTTVAPQNSDSPASGQRFSPSGPAFRGWQQSYVVSVFNGTGSLAITFPPGHFTLVPFVGVTKASAHSSALRLIPYTTAITENGCTIGLYDPTQGAHARIDIPVMVVATQATAGNREGVYRV